MTRLTESEVLRACQILFGTEIHISRGFLFYLQPEGLRPPTGEKPKKPTLIYLPANPRTFKKNKLHISEMSWMPTIL
jgi:hypothetical protein